MWFCLQTGLLSNPSLILFPIIIYYAGFLGNCTCYFFQYYNISSMRDDAEMHWGILPRYYIHCFLFFFVSSYEIL